MNARQYSEALVRKDKRIAELEAELEGWRSRYGYGVVFKDDDEFKRHVEMNGGYCLVCKKWGEAHTHREADLRTRVEGD